MDNTTNTTPVTLESIAQKKAMLLQEIRLQKEIMTGLTQEIFAPLEPATNKANAMMRAFNTGMAVFPFCLRPPWARSRHVGSSVSQIYSLSISILPMV